MLDDEKPKYRHRNKLKVEEGNKEEFSHDLAVYRIHSDNPRVTCHNRHVSICNPYLLKVEYVGRIGPVKYLYKYFYKMLCKILFKIQWEKLFKTV